LRNQVVNVRSAFIAGQGGRSKKGRAGKRSTSIEGPGFMHSLSSKFLIAPAFAAIALTGTALMAQPGHWGGRGWGHDSGWASRSVRTAPSLEGSLEVARFRADGLDPAALIKGGIVVIQMSGQDAAHDPRINATFQAAVESQLIGAGYQALPAGAAPSDQIAEVRIVRSEAVPAEGKRDPVSGEMTMGVSNRGSMLGMAVHIDGTKPKKALIETRLETRIRDRASGEVLWEGRAAILTRDGDEDWSDDASAARLARALFAGFPARTGEARERR
jgi:hypothetical protein